MKNLPWIIAGAAVGFAVYVLFNQPGLQHATGYDSVENAADRASLWGTKQRVTGKGANVLGKVKEGFGRATGDPDLADEGVGDQVVGTLKDAAGKVAGAVGDTIHDLNR